jgi:hypothetical protein
MKEQSNGRLRNGVHHQEVQESNHTDDANRYDMTEYRSSRSCGNTSSRRGRRNSSGDSNNNSPMHLTKSAVQSSTATVSVSPTQPVPPSVVQSLSRRPPVERGRRSNRFVSHTHHPTLVSPSTTTPTTTIMTTFPISNTGPVSMIRAASTPSPVSSSKVQQTPSRHRPPTTIVPIPIPSEYIAHITKAYGLHHVNLYTDVLDLVPQQHYTMTQLRVAYFRKGRAVLQPKTPPTPSSSSVSPVSTIFPNHRTFDDIPTVTPKQRFQAVTKAYEILTHPNYRAYYELYGLQDSPVMAQDDRRNRIGTVDDRNDDDDDDDDHVSMEYDDDNNTDDDNHVSHHTNNHINNDDDDDDDDDGVVSLASSTASGGSILRRPTRSRSWGPSSSSSSLSRPTSSQRVVWKEFVQELIYQPDPPCNSSGHDSKEEQRQIPFSEINPSKKYQQNVVKKKHHRPGSFNELLEQLETRDLLDDFEASVDEIGSTIESFVKYLSDDDSTKVPRTTKDRHSKQQRQDPPRPIYATNHVVPTSSCQNTNPDSRRVTAISERSYPPKVRDLIYDDEEEEDSSQMAHELFAELTKKPCPVLRPKDDDTTAIANWMTSHSRSSGGGGGGGGAYQKRMADHRRSRSHDTTTVPDCIPATTTTTTAPLKLGKVDSQPRIKPKRSTRKKKRGVDQVPSNIPTHNSSRRGSTGSRSRSQVIESFDPFQNSLDGSLDMDVMNTLMDTWQVYNGTGGVESTIPSASSTNTVSRPQTVVAVDPYELPEESSILELLDKSFEQQISKVDFISTKTLSFDDALNRTTDATTKGFIRLDRHANSDCHIAASRAVSKGVPLLDTSDVTFSSKASDDPVGRHTYGVMNGIAKSAKTTIREIASFDDAWDQDNVLPTEETASSTKMPPSNCSNDMTFLSAMNELVQTWVDDMNQFGEKISSNFKEAMTLPEAEVAGMLRLIEKELNFSKTTRNTPSNDLHQSFTY